MCPRAALRCQDHVPREVVGLDLLASKFRLLPHKFSSANQILLFDSLAFMKDKPPFLAEGKIFKHRTWARNALECTHFLQLIAKEQKETYRLKSGAGNSLHPRQAVKYHSKGPPPAKVLTNFKSPEWTANLCLIQIHFSNNALFLSTSRPLCLVPSTPPLRSPCILDLAPFYLYASSNLSALPSPPLSSSLIPPLPPRFPPLLASPRLSSPLLSSPLLCHIPHLHPWTLAAKP
eukprot:752267-Hanusia_phi.AAC.8